MKRYNVSMTIVMKAEATVVADDSLTPEQVADMMHCNTCVDVTVVDDDVKAAGAIVLSADSWCQAFDVTAEEAM